MNADSDDIAGSNGFDREWLEGFVCDLRAAIRRRSRRREDEQPARRDHPDTEREVTGIHQMDGHVTRRHPR
jgi:hypothetical protein